jgi:class 3 adenylate cyclase
MDVRSVLSTIAVPTLVLHRSNFAIVPIEHGRYLADHIAGARLVEVAGGDAWFFTEGAEQVLDEVAEFLTGVRPPAAPDRMLATVLFSDIVGSTEQAARLGDRSWRALLDAHYAILRAELDRFGGREVATTGDGFFAAFAGPARAISCACAMRDAVRTLGIEIRVGLHTGEVEAVGADLAGIAVHIGARVVAAAQPGEVLVSRTVAHLVAGSGIRFRERGVHLLKGVPGELAAVRRRHMSNAGDQWPGGRVTRPRPGGNPQPQAEVNLLHERDTRAWCSTRKSLCRLGKPAGQPVTVKVADATLPLWRPLAWKVSFRPG